MRIWDAGTGKLLRSLEGRSFFVTSVSWAADGKALASWSYDFSAIKVHTRRQLTSDGDWDGWHEWDDPEGGKGRLPYYSFKL